MSTYVLRYEDFKTFEDINAEHIFNLLIYIHNYDADTGTLVFKSDQCYNWNGQTRRINNCIAPIFRIKIEKEKGERNEYLEIVPARFIYNHFFKIPDSEEFSQKLCTCGSNKQFKNCCRLDVTHTCGNILCVNPFHLETISRTERIKTLPKVSGTKHHQATITKEQVFMILDGKEEKISQSARSKKYGISLNIIKKIDSGRKWKEEIKEYYALKNKK